MKRFSVEEARGEEEEEEQAKHGCGLQLPGLDLKTKAELESYVLRDGEEIHTQTLINAMEVAKQIMVLGNRAEQGTESVIVHTYIFRNLTVVDCSSFLANHHGLINCL